MVARSYIKNNLAFCAKRHAAASSKLETIFYAKMAILELCGWIEQSFDELVISCAKKNLFDPQRLKYLKNEVVGRTHGFDYEKHFSIMLSRLIGLIEFEKIEGKLDPTTLAKFKAALNLLKEERNREAHTYIKGTTKTLSAPSIFQNLYADVDAGLQEFEIHIKTFRRKKPR